MTVELLGKYANLINVGLMVSIIGLLFHYSRVSRNALIDTQKALEAEHELKLKSIESQNQLLEVLKYDAFVSEIKAYREHYDEKRLMLDDKIKNKDKEIESEILEKKLIKEEFESELIEKERLKNEFEEVLDKLNLGKDDLDNVREIVEERILSEVNSILKVAIHDLRTPISRMRMLPSRVKKYIEDGDAERAFKYLDDFEIIGYRYETTLLELDLKVCGVRGVCLNDFSLFEKVIFPLIRCHCKYLEIQYDAKLNLIFENEDVKKIRVKRGDPSIAIVAVNLLLDNAFRYLVEGAGDVYMELKYAESLKKLQLTISSHSMKIQDDERDKLFCKKFVGQSAQESQTSGSGSSLVLVNKILKEIGWSISFEENDDKNCFIIECPCL